MTSQASDVAVSCLECAILILETQLDYSKSVATMMFPLLLIIPKVPFFALCSNVTLDFYENGILSLYS